MFGLFDSDPYGKNFIGNFYKIDFYLGIEIFTTYKYGSEASKIEAGNVVVSEIKWIGLFPSEIVNLPIPDNQFLPLSVSDTRKIEKLIQKAKIYSNQFILNEVSEEKFNFPKFSKRF